MEIRPLQPTMAEDYLALFDTAFADNPRWAGCYCAYYDDPCDGDDWHPEQAEAAVRNRRNRRATIEAGGAHGLLAYLDGAPIGWVNAAPRHAYGNLRSMAAAVEADDPVVGSITCFVIHPGHRGRGVASRLLAACDDHLRRLGCEVAEAYPRAAPPENPAFPWTAAYYKGSPSMYAAAGFRPHRELDGFTVMRKDL